MNSPVILTHCGKLGDMLYCLPIAEWLFRHGRQVHWVLPHQFAPFRYLAPLLRLQPHCAGVTLVDHRLANLDAGGQPYRFDPFAVVSGAGDQVSGPDTPPLTPGTQYYNLGFRGYPDKFIPAYYAEEHGLDYERGYRLKLWEDGFWPLYGSGEILRSNEEGLTPFVPGEAVRLPPVMDLLALAQRVARAQEFHTWFCGLAVLAWLARIPQHVYRVPGHGQKQIYFPEDFYMDGAGTITWHEVKL